MPAEFYTQKNCYFQPPIVIVRSINDISACLIMEMSDPSALNQIIEDAVSHIEAYAAVGSDPGLCIVSDRNASLDDMIEFRSSSGEPPIKNRICAADPKINLFPGQAFLA